MSYFLLNTQNFFNDLAGSFITLIRVIILSKPGLKLKGIQNTSKECAILMNGPSLNGSVQKHREFIQAKEMICANFFPLSSLYEEFRPSRYFIVAPELWYPEVDDIFRSKSRELFTTLNEKTDWPLELFIPARASRYSGWREMIENNPNIVINYINVTPIEGLKSIRHFFYNRKLGMPRPHNILIPSLMLSIYLNYRKVYIFGADHSWLPEISVDEDNRVLIRQKHFYDDGEVKPRPMNYKGVRDRKLHEVLIKFVHAFSGYHEINDYAKSKGVEILNATQGSFIDAFKRINIEQTEETENGSKND